MRISNNITLLNKQINRLTAALSARLFVSVFIFFYIMYPVYIINKFGFLDKDGSSFTKSMLK